MRRKPNPKGKTLTEKLALTAKEEALVEYFLQYRNKSMAWELAGFDPTQKRTKVYHYFNKPQIMAAVASAWQKTNSRWTPPCPF
jgi:hypothetical protein